MTWFSGLVAMLARLFKRPPEEVAEAVPELIEGPGNWRPFEGPLKEIPEGRRALYTVYGDPMVTFTAKGVTVAKSWERANLILARDLPGYSRPLYVHRLMEPYLREGLRRACVVCPDWRPRVIGCFAPRHQRHDPTRPLSDHTWAIAVDVICPGDDKAKRINDIPEEWGAAMESVGFEWGRRWQSYRDDMHFQLRRG